jgi:hypothetical protein
MLDRRTIGCPQLHRPGRHPLCDSEQVRKDYE